MPKEKGEYNYIKSIPLLETYFGVDYKMWPEAVSLAKTNSWQSAITALGIMIAYLQDSLIAKQVVPTAEYNMFDLDTSLLFTMTLDSQALQHLEVLEVQGRTKNISEGSLLHYLDHTKTLFGKRELKRWVCSPLYDIEDILKRQDAIDDLLTNPDLMQHFIQRFTKVF